MKRTLPHNLLILLSILPILFSCSSYKKITYLNPQPAGKDTAFVQKRLQYRLQPSDILYVRIISTNKDVSDLYNPMLPAAGVMSTQQGGMYFIGFNISDSGTVDLPILGTVAVEGLSLDEAQDRIQYVTNQYLTDALAVVKLAQYKFTVLGEVNLPGYKITQADRVNIFEAISLAGDLTYSSKRNKVMVIRQEIVPEKQNTNVPGTSGNQYKSNLPPHHLSTHTYQLDLTSPDILTSEAYFIQPNDIIYVKPNFMRAFRITTGDYLLLLGSITSTITAIFLLTRL